MDYSFLIENIRHLSKVRGIAATTVCEKAGVGKSFVSDIKRGRTPSVEKVQLLADYLGVTTSELLGEKKAPATKTGDGLSEIDTIYDELTPDNQSKLLELARLYLTAQKKDEEKK